MGINSRPLCKALLKKFRLRGACYVLLVGVLTAGIFAQVSPPAPDLPSDQQVLAFLTESIDWYRHRAVEEQLATEPVDLVFLEDNRPVAAQIVQLSFEFARADASLAATFQAGKQKASAAIASGSFNNAHIRRALMCLWPIIRSDSPLNDNAAPRIASSARRCAACTVSLPRGIGMHPGSDSHFAYPEFWSSSSSLAFLPSQSP